MALPNNLVLLLSLSTLAALFVLFLYSLPRRLPGGIGASDYGAKPLLSPWELKALGEMRHELPASLHICPQVRLADLVKIRPTEMGQRQVALNRVAAKSVDFAVIDTAGRTVLVLELDDRSHDRADHRERDRLVDAVLGQGGIPVRRERPGQPVGALAALGGLTGRGQAVAGRRALSGQASTVLSTLGHGAAR